MAEEVTIVIDVDDQGTPQIEQVSGAMDDFDESAAGAGEGAQQMGDSTDEMSGQVEDAGGSVGGMSDQMGVAVGALAGVAVAMKGVEVAADLLASAVGAAVEFTEESIDAWRDQRAALRDLRMAYESSGQEGDELAGTMEDLTAVSSDFADRTLFANESVEEALAQYQRLTPEVISASEAQDDLNTILGMAEVQGMSAAGAAERFAQAQSGKVRGLDRVTSLTRDQVRELRDIEDVSERAAIATQALRDEYEGAAEDVDGLALAQSRAENAVDDVRKTLGESITENEQVQRAFRDLADSVEDASVWIEDNQDVIDTWISEAGVILQATVETLHAITQDFGTSFLEMSGDVEEGSGDVQGALDELLESAIAIAELTTAIQGVGEGARDWTPMGRLMGSVAGEAQLSFEGLENALRDIQDRTGRLREERALQQEFDEWIESMGVAGEMLVDMDGYLESLAGSSGDEADDRERAAQAQADATEETERQQEINRLRLLALNEEDEVMARMFETEADLLALKERGVGETEEELRRARLLKSENEDLEQIEQDRRQSVDDRVEAQMAEIEALGQMFEGFEAANDEYEHRNALAENQLEQLELRRNAEGEIDEIEQARLERDRELLQLQQQIDDMTDLEKEAREQEILLDYEHKRNEAIRQRRNEEERAEEERARQTQMQLRGIDQHISGLGTLAASMHELREGGWDFAESYQAAQSAISGAAELGGTAADVLTETREEQAAVEGAFHTAAAIANTALAIANPAMSGVYGAAAAQHGVAAAQFFAVAGGVGASSGGASGGGGGASPQATGDIEFDDDDTGGDVIYEIDFSGATTLEDSQSTGRRIRDATEAAEAERYRVGGR